MSEKLKFIKVLVVKSEPRPGGNSVQSQLDVFLPIDAIRLITARDLGNPTSDFVVSIKAGYLPDDTKFNGTIMLSREQVEIVNK